MVVGVDGQKRVYYLHISEIAYSFRRANPWDWLSKWVVGEKKLFSACIYPVRVVEGRRERFGVLPRHRELGVEASEYEFEAFSERTLARPLQRSGSSILY